MPRRVVRLRTVPNVVSVGNAEVVVDAVGWTGRSDAFLLAVRLPPQGQHQERLRGAGEDRAAHRTARRREAESGE